MASNERAADCCDNPLIMSLDSMPPYVYCTRCKKTRDCPRCGAKGTDGQCFPDECSPAAPGKLVERNPRCPGTTETKEL